MTNIIRQPKGTSVGGRFAPHANPESALDLDDLVPADSVAPRLSGGLAELEALAKQSDGRIIVMTVGNIESPAPAESVWAVELNEMDGFVHHFVKAVASEEAVKKVLLKEGAPINCVVAANKRDESLGDLLHQQVWPHGEVLLRERGHAFASDSMFETIPDLYDQEDIPLADQIVHAHFFSANGDWYITELDKEDGTAFGRCDLGMGFPELGYVNLIELEETRNRFGGAAVERDLHFEPKTMGDLGFAQRND